MLASEAGVLRRTHLAKGPAPAGQLLVDLEQGRIVPDAEAEQVHYRRLGTTAEPHVLFADLRHASRHVPTASRCAACKELAFSYARNMKVMLAPLAMDEAIGSMGNDTPLAVLSGQGALVVQAASRTGHEPADRPDPRSHRHEREISVGSERNSLLDETQNMPASS